jgi:hypothetical protein
MEPNVLIALITSIGSILGAIIGALASIKVAAITSGKEKAEKPALIVPTPPRPALREPRTWLWFLVGAIAGGALTLSIIFAYSGLTTVGRGTVTPIPTEVEATTTAGFTSAMSPVSEETTAPGITYGFEDGTSQGWQAWEEDVGRTIKALTVTETVSFSGKRALQIDVKGLSGSKGATIYLEGTTPTQVFSVKAKLPSNAPSDVNVWIQLAAASAEGFHESEIVYLSRNRWRTIEWDTSSFGWENGSVRAIYVQLGAGSVEYSGHIYIDDIYVR